MRIYDITNGFIEAEEGWEIGSGYYWVICEAKELDILSGKVRLDSESLEECRNIKQFGKISFFDSYLFVVFNILEYIKEEINSRELDIFLGKDFIITIYKEKAEIIEEFLKDIRESKNCFILKENPRPSILLYYILDRIIVRNYNIISYIEAQADRIEINILKNPKEEHAKSLINLRRQVFKIRKYLNPLRYIGDSLIINDNKVIEDESIKYFESLNKKISKLMLSQETLVQDLALVREAFESEIANKTNALMKVFTIVASVFLPLDLITSIFGMSFSYMPLRDSRYGFHSIMLFILSITFFLVGIFKKNKWL